MSGQEATVAEQDAIATAIAAAVGRQSVPDAVAPYPVERATIARWCDAVGDRNPVYVDPDAARRHGFGDVVAPPAMIDAWNGIPFRLEPPADTGPAPGAFGALMAVLREHGCTSVVATDCEQTYVDHVRLGDVVHCAETIADVSQEKATSLGRGHFVTVERRYTATPQAGGDGGEREVAQVAYRRFYFRPGTGRRGGAGKAPAAAPEAPQEPLSPLAVLLTPSVIVAGAIASIDFYPGHHDPVFAREAGLQDIIMNIRTTNGWVSRYATDWAGPAARLRRLAVRLGTPNYPHETMEIGGAVRASEQRDDVRHVQLDVTIRNPRGTHATAQVDLVLPHG